MAQICRRGWLDRQGIRQPGLAPCGECDVCKLAPVPPSSGPRCRCERSHPEISWLRDADVAAVAAAAHEAIADDDPKAADRLLTHATHLGISPSTLFTAGGKKRKPKPVADLPAEPTEPAEPDDELGE